MNYNVYVYTLIYLQPKEDKWQSAKNIQLAKTATSAIRSHMSMLPAVPVARPLQMESDRNEISLSSHSVVIFAFALSNSLSHVPWADALMHRKNVRTAEQIVLAEKNDFFVFVRIINDYLCSLAV